MVSLVLASKSPARLSTLRSAGVEPHVIVSDVDEDAVLAAGDVEHREQTGSPLPTGDAVLALARAKAEAVASALPADAVGAIVLGCDSMLELDGAVLGKPGTAAIARERWLAMRGRVGVLHTGHWLVDARPGGEEVGATSSTVVRFGELTEEEIDAYVATGEPLHVAGAFTVDGLGGPYVESIEGDYHGVVGVSLPLLRRLLGDLGVAFHELRHPSHL